MISSTYISIKNSLCYSFIPLNRYETNNMLCNINCSYIRKISFPLNTPLKCDFNASYNKKYLNDYYYVYYFNTSTYGLYRNNYRSFYYKGNV